MRAPESLADMWVQVAADPRGDADATAGVLAEAEANAATLAGLAWLDHWSLSDSGRVDRLAAIRRHIAYLTAVQTRMLAEFAAEREADDCAAMELAQALLVSQQSASARMTHAAYVARVLPAALDALQAGDITEAHVRALVDTVRGMPDDLAQRVEGRVLARATGAGLARWRQVLRRAVAELDARGQDDKHTAAREQRRVAHSPAPDGMAELWAFLPAEDAVRVNAAISQVARLIRYDDDPRTADQLRADALVAIADHVLTGTCPTTPTTPDTSDTAGAAGAGAGAGGRRRGAADGVVNVTIPASVLFGTATAPGELAGYGPVSAEHARALAALADRMRVLVVDEHGRLLVRSATTYRIPTALQGHVKARDQFCTFPGCRNRAERVDSDHVIPWPDGPTHQANLHALCRRHHRLKQRPGWSITRDDHTGRTTWRSPTGHIYPTEPPPLPTDPDNTD